MFFDRKAKHPPFSRSNASYDSFTSLAWMNADSDAPNNPPRINLEPFFIIEIVAVEASLSRAASPLAVLSQPFQIETMER
jgi:hypothetical protein